MGRKSAALGTILYCFLGFLYCAKFGGPEKPPIARAVGGGEYFFTDTVYLDASGSYDPQGRPLTYIWNAPGTLPFGEIIDSLPRHRFLGLPKGTYTFTLTVFDGFFYSKPDQLIDTITGADIIVTKRPGRFPGGKVFEKLSLGLTAAKSGDTVFVDSGSYDDSVSIVTNDLFIYGPSSNKPIIDGKNFSFAPISIFGAVDVTLKNLVITGAAEAPDCGGIVINNSSNVRIGNCRIFQNQSDGVHIVGSGNRGVVRIDSCLIDNNKYSGVWCDGSTISMSNCIFFNNAATKTDTSKHTAALFIDSSSGSTVSLNANTFLQSNDFQVWNDGPSVVNANYNVFDSVFGGFYIPSQSNAVVTMANNRFNHVRAHCIWCQGVSGVDLTVQQDSLSSLLTPIWCDGAKNVSIVNNAITFDKAAGRDITQKGIDLGGCDSGEIAGNSINGFLIGIILNQAPVRLVGNTFIKDSVCLCNYMSANNPPDLAGINDWSGCIVDTTSIYLVP